MTGLEDMDTFISRHYNKVTKYIATWPIIDLSLEAEGRLELRVSIRWWDQEVIYFTVLL